MNTANKRKDTMEENKTPKRVKKECSYGETCYRRNPAHFREFSHPHLESILDASTGEDYIIPDHLNLQRHMIMEQLEVIVEKQLYVPVRQVKDESSSSSTTTTNNQQPTQTTQKYVDTGTTSKVNTINNEKVKTEDKLTVNKREKSRSPAEKDREEKRRSLVKKESELKVEVRETKTSSSGSRSSTGSNNKGPDYVPIIPPTRRAEDFLKVVRPRGKMAEKHAASAPYHIFYTTITDAKETHNQPFSITFLEILDSSLGELKCSLQINFMVEIAWLLAQYYFAGYSQKRLTILYGEDCSDLKTINSKKPHVDAHYVSMPTPFGKHHTKMMILCYEDGSLRVVVSTANLYLDDWENRTQGLWLSPACPELPAGAMPHEGESPTSFKKSLLRYLNHYHMPQLSYYVERVKRCDFSHINVFLVATAPGGHFDQDWGLTRIGSLLRQHCCIRPEETRQWSLVAQASSIGSYGKEPKYQGNIASKEIIKGLVSITRIGSLLRQHCCIPPEETRQWSLVKEPKLWLTGDFLHNFTKIKNQSQMLSTPPELKLIYPSLENVRQSHDGLLGGGCLPYGGDAHAKQTWLTNYLYQWQATSTHRNRAMPHIKSYTRTNRDATLAAFYLLTSANVSKAAWGQINKGNAALRTMSYEAGVLFLPRFIINEDFFPLQAGVKNRLIIPYDLPPTKYTPDMSPWVQDYLR